MTRFLLVEAHNTFREGLALVLKSRTGFDNVQAASLAEASRHLGSSHVTIDLAIVDADLFGEDGIKLIENLRETEIRVLALVSAQDSNRRADALRAGADEVVSMQEPIEELVRAARRLGGEDPMVRG